MTLDIGPGRSQPVSEAKPIEDMTDEELQSAIELLQATRIPNGPSQTSKRRPRRLDDPTTAPKRRSWKDDFFTD